MSYKHHKGIQCNSCHRLFLPFQLNEEQVCAECLLNSEPEYEHVWEPTDKSGHYLQCINCGEETSIFDPDYDKILESECRIKPDIPRASDQFIKGQDLTWIC